MLVRRNGPTRINSCRALPENLLEKQARIQANPVHLFNPLIQPAYSARSRGLSGIRPNAGLDWIRVSFGESSCQDRCFYRR
jgi:hypothetical protein